MDAHLQASLVKLTILVALPAILLLMVGGSMGGRLAARYVEMIFTLPFKILGVFVDMLKPRR